MEGPAPAFPKMCIFIVGMPSVQWALALFCLLKVWIFKKIDVIGERLTYRQEWFNFMLKIISKELVEPSKGMHR